MVPRTLAGASPSRKTGEGARPTTERPGLGGAPPSTAAGTYPPPDRGVPLSLSLEPCAAPMPRAGAESPAEPRSALAPERTPARRRSPFLALPRPAAAPAPAGDSERSERSRVVDERPLDKNTSNVSGPGAQSPRVAQRSGGDPALSPSPSRSDNRRRRYDLREALRGVTTLGRVGKCGRCRIRGAVVIRAGIGGAHFSGIAACGSVWCCPVCAAKIAARRCGELTGALTRHIDAGGGGEFLTLTLPHDAGDALSRTRAVASGGWRKVIAGRAWRDLAAGLGIVGTIRALEVTHGAANGWHPHLHVLILAERPLSEAERARLQAHCFARWCAHVTRSGFRAPEPYLCPIERVRGAEAGMYATKFGAALELTHDGQKYGRGGRRAPFQILSYFCATVDAADLELWQEWERGSRGAKQLTWSHGLKARLAVTERTDEEIASEDVGGEDVAVIAGAVWDVIARIPGAPVRLLEAAESGGAAEVLAVLEAIGPPGAAAKVETDRRGRWGYGDAA